MSVVFWEVVVSMNSTLLVGCFGVIRSNGGCYDGTGIECS